MALLTSFILSALFSQAQAQAVLIEDGSDVGRSHNTTIGSTPTRPIFPISQRSQFKRFEEEPVYQSAEEMRGQRRMGLGAQVAGTAGLLGVNLELNFAPNNSANIGFGGAPGFNTMSFQWKHQFNKRFFSPYIGMGYSRWYNTSSASTDLKKAAPGVINKFLSEEQKKTGKFEIDLLTPAVGLYYHMLSGAQVGMTYFGEVTFLTDISKPEPTPIAGLGALYYF